MNMPFKDTLKQNEYMKQYRLQRKEYLKKKWREWRLKNPERYRESKRKWRESPQGKEYMRQYMKKYSRENLLSTIINGKRVKVKVRKRDRSERCELCSRKPNRIVYHHWDMNNLNLGIWICIPCHTACEKDEVGIIDKYRKLKQKVKLEFEVP